MTAHELQELMADPRLLTQDTLYKLRTLLVRYPYFQTVRLLYLKNLSLLNDSLFEDELHKSSLFVADRRVMFGLLEGDRYRVKTEERPVPQLSDDDTASSRTMALIDAFLDGQSDETLVPVVPDASSDYISYMLRAAEEEEQLLQADKEASPKLKGQELIDSFLSKAGEEGGVGASGWSRPQEVSVSGTDEFPEQEIPSEDAPDDVSIEDDESCFTETLAKIYVKQQRYSKALEIIKKLSLKYPKKNAYFADQIRFLEKLIINANSK